MTNAKRMKRQISVLVAAAPRWADVVGAVLRGENERYDVTTVQTRDDVFRHLNNKPDLLICDQKLVDGKAHELAPQVNACPMLVMIEPKDEKVYPLIANEHCRDYIVKTPAALLALDSRIDELLRLWTHNSSKKRLDSTVGIILATKPSDHSAVGSTTSEHI